jgi:type VI secretion system protein ImpC
MNESVQHQLNRVRPPRVQITYDVEIGGALEKRELPFTVGIIAPVSAKSDKPQPPLRDRKMVYIDRSNFNKVLESIEPRVKFEVPNTLPGDDETLSVNVAFTHIDQFAPLEVVKKVDGLRELHEERSKLRELLTRLDGNDPFKDILAEVLDRRVPQEALFRTISDAADALAEALKLDRQEERDAAVVDITGIITKRITQMDTLLSRQLNHVLHHKDFQANEACWRGLHYLVMNTQTGDKLKLRLLNAGLDELYEDLDNAVDFDQSALFKIICEDEFGTHGGNPYSCLIGDYELGHSPRDFAFLEKISGVAAAAHAPFIASAYARLFDREESDMLYKPRDPGEVFDSVELTNWRSFRESENSRYVTLTLPRVMMRLPYDPVDNPVEGIYFNEDVANARSILWGNPAYVLGQRITNAYSLYGWAAAIRGIEGGGLVENLPTYTLDTGDGDVVLTCPTQVFITDRYEEELNDLGFMAICHSDGTGKAVFVGGQSTDKPNKYLAGVALKNEQAASMLPYMLVTSRFAHYMKVLMREKIGSFLGRESVQDYLNNWISQYVLLDDEPTQSARASFPLREARVEVTDVQGNIGAYLATMVLRPHFQLEELTTSIKLEVVLPS